MKQNSERHPSETLKTVIEKAEQLLFPQFGYKLHEDKQQESRTKHIGILYLC